MAAVLASNQRLSSSSGNRPSNLPVIEHPKSRLGDRRTLNVIGSSRGDLVTSSPRRDVVSPASVGRRTPPGVVLAGSGDYEAMEGVDNLPPLQGGNENRGRRTKHNRMLTWPPVHEQRLSEKRARSAKAKYLHAVPKQRYATDQLVELIRDRLTTSYYGLRQSFRANDPMGQGNAPKSAMGRILFHVVGFISPDEVNKLLERLGLDNQDPISFDAFIGCFRDNETVKREWLSPATRLDMAANTRHFNAEEHLRQLGGRELPEEFKTASFGIALLKEKCKHSNFNIRNHLAPSCFDLGGAVLAPQLRECLASLGVQLYDEEMDKLWHRYDLEGTGAIDSVWFFAQLGLDSKGNYSLRAQTAQPKLHRYSGTPLVPEIVEEEAYGAVSPDMPQEAPRQPTPEVDALPRQPSSDIISYLLRRVEQGFHSLLMGFEHFDHQDSGTITKTQFCTILQEYDIPLSLSEADTLLERCAVRRKDGVLSYRDFLHRFMSRSENGVAHRIMSDPSHRFNTRGQTPFRVASLSAADAEAKLMELLHKDFLRLLGTLKNLDSHGLNLVTQKQLRNAIDSVFNIHMTDQQFQSILNETGVEADGLVPYPEFLGIFNRKRPTTAPLPMTPKPNSPIYGKPAIASPRQPKRQPSPPQALTPEPPVVAHEIQTENITPPEYHRQWRRDAENAGLTPAGPVGWMGEEGKGRSKMETRYRPVKELEDMIADYMTKKGYKAQEAYEKIDRKSTGRMSKTQMHYWLQELGILLHPTELQMLWTSLDISKDGLVHYAELFDYFLHRSKKGKHVKKKSEPTRHLQFNKPDNERSKVNAEALRDHFSTPIYDDLTSQMIGLIRPKVLKYWSEIKNTLKDLDPLGVGTVPIPMFQNLCHQTGFNLSGGQLDRLCSHFDFNQNGQFHYLQFMQLFVDGGSKPKHAAVHQSSIPISNHSIQQTRPVTALANIKKQLPSDWKAIRRAFKKADVTNEGKLQLPEFGRVLAANKIYVTDEDMYHIVCDMDSGMDGKISYDKFLSQVVAS
ncbi:EF-hand calcium-binding domain-containing protein 6-like [Amphiura filiformis]|uniref:EF-hand calcium-binding domain-containing protein 6-like n=1 Tax=Amphiura filiformis TaxID=82378 RepID=UPI003B228F03